ncbi:MAG: FAD-binding oxidoreductase [Leptolyngbya sp. PLA1]|nr:FAD-binding oxidoreductase [Leptolyngbya sp. PLA1]
MAQTDLPTPGDARSRRALQDLANQVEGEVRLDAHDRMLYATDASLYQVEPLGVVIPADTEDALRALRVCAAHGVPVLPRGGGTSLAGQCTNRAIVIDLSVSCGKVLDVDAPARTCRVEPGITVDDLNDALARMGGEAATLFFAPDPATSRHANVGGCIGNNAAGARSILYGRTSENVLGVDAALADGERVTFCEGASDHSPRAARLTMAVCEIVAAHAPAIRERFPKTVRRNAGYGLDMMLAQMERAGWRDGARVTPEIARGVNLAHLLCGSEGTLALTLGATLRLHKRPGAKGLAVLGFESVDAAIEAVLPILTTRPSAVELLDDTVIELARANTQCRGYVDLMPRPREGRLAAVLYVEYFGASPAEITERFRTLSLAVPGVARADHTDASSMAAAWMLRKSGEPLLHGIPGARKPITFIEDNAIPVERLGEFVRELRAIVASHGTRAAYYAHASVGVLHVRPLLDVHDESDLERMRSIAVGAADLARRLGGVMSGEHGDGRVRTPLLERHFGPDLMRAFAGVKRAFDPANLLNPGNIVQIGDGPVRTLPTMTEALRVRPRGLPVPAPSGTVTFFDYADQHGLDGAVEMCNGAGVCRKKQGGTMCPSYQATLDERHSTRGRGNALRLAITGQLASMDAPGGRHSRWDDPGTIQTLDLCLSCKACKTECPSNVDISRLKAEYTAQRYAQSGTPLRERVFGNVRALNRLGSLLPGLSNALSERGPLRAIAGAVLGLHPRRSLPRFARALPLEWQPAPGRDRRVVFFGDCFSMFNEPGVGLASKRVMEACGYEVVLAQAGCCGRAKISTGLLPQAITEIDATIAALAPFADDPRVEAILVAEPSCLSAIKDDWRSLKLGADALLRERLARLVSLPEDFLERAWDRHPVRPAFSPGERRVLLHGHCHQKALWGIQTSAAPLRRVFGERLQVLDTGCCGMAGSFGFARERFELSMRIGELTLLPAIRGAGPCEVAAPGTSCRHQVHDGAHVRAKHPIELIAEALALS